MHKYEQNRIFDSIKDKTPDIMKYLFTLVLLTTGGAAIAQPVKIAQATITTKTTVIIPEGAENDGPTAVIVQRGGDGQQVTRTIGDGETISKTYVKNDKTKTVVENEMGRTTTIRDNTAKKTTTLLEMMGRKNGFYATDEEQEQMKKRMDSMIQSRSAGSMIQAPAAPELVYADGSRKIAGYDCKKALLISSRPNGTFDTALVWYAPGIAFESLKYTGNPGGGFMGMATRNSTVEALEKINGFPLAYEINGRRGRKTIVEVTKIDTKKEVADKEFEIPKDFEVKPMKDMQGPGGGIQMRIGGPPPTQ